ncbi:MAG: hypothetical protein KBG07_05930, partial [Elusimicrobia bacterium]|nr:hypothetical protein [Elusimicrobiota bacterium]
PVFFGRGKRIIVGQEGVSLAFSLGMVRIDGDTDAIRKGLKMLAHQISSDSYFTNVPSVKKRTSKGEFYFHAKDDIPEIREKMFRYLKECELSYEAVVARKEPSRFISKHNGDEAEFYADVLGHLIKNKLELGKKLVLNIAHRQNSTGNKTLQLALDKAAGYLFRRKTHAAVTSQVIFNVTTPIQEPILWIADYLGWAVQRVFERGETRHYEFIREKIGQVCDLYDTRNYQGGKNFYGRNRPLTGDNKIGPPPL